VFEWRKITMKFKKISTVAAAIAAAAMMAVSASAADWSQAGYADDDPGTVNIISTSADGAVFEQTSDGLAVKLRITLDQILENPDDASKIKTGSFKMTYRGLAGSDIQGIGGACYAGTQNSSDFWLSPEFNDDGTVTWEDEVSTECTINYLLPSKVPDSTAEFVFMDWSSSNFASAGVTIEVSDLHLYDEDGNEIAQKAYSGSADAAADTTETVEDTADTTVEDTADTTTETTTEVVTPASDDTTSSATTGNASAAAIASVMAVAAAAAVAAKK
jgi:hypothetical protein